jgi:hypothetical protein
MSGAVSATYLARYARERIAEADATIALHVASAVTGCCTGCGRAGPCDEQLAAERVLAGYDLLPRRDPGATLRPPAGQPSWSAFNRPYPAT